MSETRTIVNPLDAFQSYSVQYVMVACRTTVVAAAFAADANNTSTLAAIDQVQALGDPVKLQNSNDDVYLVLDTRRFAQFSVESLKYDVYINGLSKGGSTSNLAADLSMVILDSVGVSFANYLQWLMDSKMKTNFDGLVFMLRTIFVGHHADGRTETVQSETIPMHLIRVDVNLDYAKGAYTLEFMPNMNFDVNKYERFLNVSTVSKYKTGTGNTLGGLIDNLQTELNNASKKYYDEVQKVVASVGAAEAGQFGRRVEYMITIPERWKKWVLKGPSQGNVTETKQSKEPNGTVPPANVIDSNVATKPGTPITKILDETFAQVTEIAEMGNFKSTDASSEGSITFYKHIVGLTSSNETLCVHVDVVEFEVPNHLRRKPDEKAVSSIDSQFYKEIEDPNRTGGKLRVPRDFIEYDYIFTGKNKDILSFDMKIQDFQFLLASNLKIGTNELANTADAAGEIKDTSTQKAVNDLMYARKYDPIMIPMDTKKALEAFSTVAGALRKKDDPAVKSAQQYTRNLSMFYAASPIIANITIKGNPLIMHKVNIGTVLAHPTSDSASTTAGTSFGQVPREQYRADLETRILKVNPSLQRSSTGAFALQTSFSERSYATSPVFVKLNVKGPTVDFRTNEASAPPYSSSVIENQYYVMFKISNIIQGHMFTQELELYSHNIYGSTGTTKIQS